MEQDRQLNQAAQRFKALQTQLIKRFDGLESSSATFCLEPWQRGAGGGGRMAMMRQGDVIEKGGVHFSDVFGEMPQALAGAMTHKAAGSAGQAAQTFRACGVSVIIHTRNPHAPSAHMNLRHIMMTNDAGTRSWFGGGADLTPMLAAYRSAAHGDTMAFHHALEKACAAFSQVDYAVMKKTCADYFYLPHRKTERGVGGVFFDELHSGDWNADFAFVQALGEAFLATYPLLVEKRASVPWTKDQRAEQARTRSLYAEFNLLYDRGTQFGLKSGGNVESILSSLPPLAVWD